MHEPHIDADGRFHHPCSVCGKDANLGFGVSIYRGRLGTWYCAEHLPKNKPRSKTSLFTAEEVNWLNKTREPTTPGICPHCGEGETPDSVLLPFGADDVHYWIHQKCWPEWFQARRERAAKSVFQATDKRSAGNDRTSGEKYNV
jgi:hypothetical protein